MQTISCPGCGLEHKLISDDAFDCICGTRIEPNQARARIFTPADVPEHIRRLYEGARQPAARSQHTSTSSAVCRYTRVAGGWEVVGLIEEVASLIIPASVDGAPVIRIARAAFKGAPLASVHLPDEVEIIGEDAFAECHALISVSGARGVKRIDERAFQNCVNLKSISAQGAPDADITSFAGCYSLGIMNEHVTYRRSSL